MTALHQAVGERQSEVESILEQSLAPLVHDSLARHSTYERMASFRELMELSAGQDCNYDRPSVGVAYACWYHPRRLGDGCQLLYPLLSTTDEDIQLLDLGCGTGALWWAAAFIESTRVSLGGTPRVVQIDAIDASPAMLDVARSMWNVASPLFGTHHVEVTPRLSSWLDRPPSAPRATAVMSYVFDHSDATRLGEVGERLGRVLDASGVTSALMATSSRKQKLHTAATRGLTETERWQQVDLSHPPALFAGTLAALGRLRAELVHGCELDARDRSSATRSPKWSGNVTSFLRFDRSSAQQMELQTREVERLVLDGDQDLAATPDGRMTAVLGSAGSGKSRILIERLVREVERRRPGDSRELRVLVTAFNKALMVQLYDWFIEAHPDGLVGTADRSGTGQAGCRVVKGSTWTVEFRNFDQVLVEYVGVRPRDLSSSMGVFNAVKERLTTDDVCRLEGKGFAFPDFYSDELHRVVYGLGALTKEDYSAVARRGRGLPLRVADRDAVWAILRHPVLDKVFTWEHARIQALVNVREGRVESVFDLVFADECQDFVPADFEVLHSLVKSPTGLSVYGDSAQGLHVGSSHWIPPREGARWRRHRLGGSYRLPLKVCDAVRPLSAQIARRRTAEVGGAPEDSEVVIPIAMKAATPGTRPIVITGDGATIADQVAQIALAYEELVAPDGQRTITFAELTSAGLREAVESRLPEWDIESATMLKIKGLERPFVVWSTDSHFGRRSTVAEWIFTILTRSTAVTVIALHPKTSTSNKAVVARLERSSLLFWTPEAEHLFDSWRAIVDSEEDPLSVAPSDEADGHPSADVPPHSALEIDPGDTTP